jgi:aspartyl-tRNA(Asn)/glutamyl-tRNA(Gln) amidotransferase subunit C
MAVTEDDVRHIAHLARLRLEVSSLKSLVAELNGILEHMDELRAVDTQGVEAAEGIGASGTPLRADIGPPVPLARAPESFAPSMRDGFLLVPRLATHEDSGGGA